MERIFTKHLLAAGILLAASVLSPAQTREETQALKSAVEADLYGNILPFWSRNAVDPAGGFHGTLGMDGAPVPGAEKGAVLNGRIIWTFANAYRHCPAVEYKDMTDRAAAYYRAHFIDRRSGGVFWTLDAHGYPADKTLQTYAAAFGVYGLSENFRATGCEESLEAAIGIYRAIEEHAHDKVLTGYSDTFDQADVPGVDGKKGAVKTMNTHIHVLEAYTNLYRVWPDKALRENLRELLGILQTRLYDAQGSHLIIYCDKQWNPIGDPVSYGHDIETSWLMTEAAEVLGDETVLEAVRKQAVAMVDAAMTEGIDAQGRMLNGTEGNQVLEWWPQAETVIGCINAWQITGQEKYFRAAERSWEHIQARWIDRENGGWFKKMSLDGAILNAPKGSLWNCPYHNSRMGSELSDRLAFPSVDSEVMAWSNLTGIRMDGELVDFESSLRVGVPGGKIEASGREKQRGILQWQLTSDYSLLLGDGIYGTEGPLRPTQRFFNIRQLAMTPENAFVVPTTVNKQDINVVGYAKPATGECAVHIVNNAGASEATVSGLPEGARKAIVLTTNRGMNSEAARYEVTGGTVTVPLPAVSFATLLVE